MKAFFELAALGCSEFSTEEQLVKVTQSCILWFLAFVEFMVLNIVVVDLLVNHF